MNINKCAKKSNEVNSFIPTTIIEPPKGWFNINIRELWQFRELLVFLTWRDISVKYKQALLGFAWAILVPFLQMVVFGFIFGKFAGMPTNGLDPFLFYFAGLVPWTYFATSLTMASNSMVGQSKLLTKIYLPRLFIPSSACIANLLDFVLAFSILILMMFIQDVTPAYSTFFVPFIMLMGFVSVLGVSFFFSALSVKYRDIKFVIPFLIQIWMYCTVIYPFDAIPNEYKYIKMVYGLNPMAFVIEGTRWCLAHNHMSIDNAGNIPVPFPMELFIVGLPVCVIIFIIGVLYFKRMEKMFADVV